MCFGGGIECRPDIEVIRSRYPAAVMEPKHNAKVARASTMRNARTLLGGCTASAVIAGGPRPSWPFVPREDYGAPYGPTGISMRLSPVITRTLRSTSDERVGGSAP